MKQKFLDFFKKTGVIRVLALLVCYTFIITVSLLLSYFIRFDFDFNSVEIFLDDIWKPILLVVGVDIFSLFLFRQFQSVIWFFHMRDMFSLVWSQVFAFSIIFVVVLLTNTGMLPRGVLIICFIGTSGAMLFARIGLRILRERMLYSETGNPSTKVRVAIIGAGNLGVNLASDLLSKRNLGIEPVVFLDDSDEKVGKFISGIEVEKIPENFTLLKRRLMIDRAIIASLKFSAKRLSEITTALGKAGIVALIQPSYFDFAMGRMKLAPIRQVNVLDVLGRDPIDLNDSFIDDSLRGKTVMVTGAGGSIGSELCRQIAMRNVERLILVEHCEVQLFKVEQELLSMKFGVAIKSFVASVCDAPRMERIIERFKPQVIFHAAAHKHVPLMEYQPSEALKNNVLGTWTIADIASRKGVEKFLLISTDKAVNPTNVMGASKRFAELVVQSMQARENNKTIFVAVRFGNVLGSSGSVIPTFKKQIEMGGPITLTHPDVTRYFMTIPEAVGLVLQCGAQANGGEIFVLNMGEPIRILDLAKRMITLSGFEPDVDIKIEIIGLRPGEKLYEELQNKDERLVNTEHSRIYRFACTPELYDNVYAKVSKIKSISDTSSINDLKKFIAEVVPEYCVQYYD